MINPDARPNTDQRRYSFELVQPEEIPEVAAFMQPVYADTYPNEARGTTKEMFDDPLFREHVEEYLGDQLATPGRNLWVARDEQGIVGSIGLEADADPSNPEIWGFYVDVDRQGEGVGSELWEQVMSTKQLADADKVHLNVAVDSPQAAHFYEDKGMQKVGEPFTVQWPQWKQEYRDAGLTNEYQRMEMNLR